MFNYKEFLNEKKYTHKKLSSRFWNNYQFDQKVRKKLLKISDDFFKSLEIDLPIEEIKLTGSLANYNYTNNSDLDIHIIIDFDKYKGNTKVLNEMLKSKGFIWNLKHNIKIKGADVELYVQPKTEKHISTGLFSLLNNEWIKKPKYTDPDVDEDDVQSKYDKWVSDINNLSKSIKKKNIDIKDLYKKTEKMKNKLRKFRKKGLEKGVGEFSVENVAYKKLRNDEYIDELYDLSYKLYDMIFSQ